MTRDLWKCVLTCGEMSKPGSGEFVFDYLNRRLWTLTIDIPVLQQPMNMWWYNVENLHEYIMKYLLIYIVYLYILFALYFDCFRLMLFHNLIFFFLSSNITDGTCSVEIRKLHYPRQRLDCCSSLSSARLEC